MNQIKNLNFPWGQPPQTRLLDRKLRGRQETKEDPYVLLESEGEVDRYFDRLRDGVSKIRMDSYGQEGSKLWFEHGTLSESRRYFFIQPWNEEGWLFERSPYGWTISKAAKIVESKTFLRHSSAWEVVVLFKPESGEGLVRLSSKRLGQEMMCYPIYEQSIFNELQIEVRQEL